LFPRAARADPQDLTFWLETIVLATRLNLIALGLIGLAAGGCAHSRRAEGWTAVEAVRLVAASPQGIAGTFRMKSLSFRLEEGRQNGGVYLFSTRDYRDPDCLTLLIGPKVAQEFKARGEELPFALSARLIEVTGTARRVKALKTNTALAEPGLYDRTQIDVTDAKQIRLVAPP
jgi:hypothetical protein